MDGSVFWKRCGCFCLLRTSHQANSYILYRSSTMPFRMIHGRNAARVSYHKKYWERNLASLSDQRFPVLFSTSICQCVCNGLELILMFSSCCGMKAHYLHYSGLCFSVLHCRLNGMEQLLGMKKLFHPPKRIGERESP